MYVDRPERFSKRIEDVTDACVCLVGAGELEVFSSLEEQLSLALPQEPCEWRRSLGRPVRDVHIGVRFSPFSPEALPRETQWDLVRQPLFHVYWTECSVSVCVTPNPDFANQSSHQLTIYIYDITK